MAGTLSEFVRADDFERLREQYIQLCDENRMLREQVHDLRERKHKSRKTDYYECARGEEIAALRKQIDDLKEQVHTLTQHMTCPICLSTMEKPHVLPCGHTYCKQCLDQIVNHKCPNCRKSFDYMAPDYALNQSAAVAGTILKSLANEVPHTNEELPTNGNVNDMQGDGCDWNEDVSRKMMRHLRYKNNDIERDPYTGYVEMYKLAALLGLCEDSIYEVAKSSVNRGRLRFELSLDGRQIRASRRSNDRRRRS